MIIKNPFLRDVLVTATEGGINYWADVQRRSLKDITAAIVPIDETPLYLQDDDLRAAIAKIFRGDVEINPEIWRDIVCAVAQEDASDIDAEGADAIVQIALFGEIVYG